MSGTVYWRTVKWKVAIVMFFALPASCFAADDRVPAAEGYGEIAENLSSLIRSEMQTKDLPAFSIALVEGSDVVWAEGFGYRDTLKREPATARTVYRVGSVSKLLTDIAVMQLVEQGKLSLDESVRKYITDFALDEKTETPITLGRLMSHRAGIVREPPVGHYFDPDEPSLAATVASLGKTGIVYPPGTRTKYSNAGISVVGLCVERTQRTPFSKYLRSTILGPIGMHDSDFERTETVRRLLATGWMRTYDGRRFEAPTFQLGTGPAGNLYSNVLDLSKFITTILRGGRAGDVQLLRPETLRMMTAPQKDEKGEPLDFGIGFHVAKLDGHKKIGHGGAIYGYSTQVEVLPERNIGVAAVCSLDGSNGLVRRISDYALRMMLARADKKPLERLTSTDRIAPERARQLSGRYRHERDVVELVEDDGRVHIWRDSFRYEVRARGDELVVDDVIGYGPTISREGPTTLKIDGKTYERLEDKLPAPCPEKWTGLIGEYGWDHNTLYILEDHGKLVALIEWFYTYPLEEIGENEFAFPDYGLYHGERLVFSRDAKGNGTQVVAAEVLFKRREVGTQGGKTFKIEPVEPVEKLRPKALAAQPPKEKGEFRKSELVDLTTVEPGILLDIRYATTNNFTGAVFYRQPRAFMQRPAAEAVARAHRRLKDQGLGLLVHDAYRPWHVTKMFWDATPQRLRDFVADPSQGSRHNRGCAVDLTLYELKTGKAVTTVAGYDEFSPRSFPEYPGGTSRQRYYRNLLRRTMEAEGFTVYEYEWWHFDYKDWRKYAIGNLTFEEIDPASAAKPK